MSGYSAIAPKGDSVPKNVTDIVARLVLALTQLLLALLFFAWT